MSASVNVPQYKPGPRFEAHKKPDRIRARQDTDLNNNEIPQAARLVQPQPQAQPKAESLPRPQALIQPQPPKPRAEFEETVRSVGSKPDKIKV